VLGAQAGSQAPIEKSRGRMRRPVETLRKGFDRLVFGGEMGTQFDDVEPRPGMKLEREVERLCGRQCL
jgi:hypothetical protein